MGHAVTTESRQKSSLIKGCRHWEQKLNGREEGVMEAACDQLLEQEGKEARENPMNGNSILCKNLVYGACGDSSCTSTEGGGARVPSNLVFLTGGETGKALGTRARAKDGMSTRECRYFRKTQEVRSKPSSANRKKKS